MRLPSLCELSYSRSSGSRGKGYGGDSVADLYWQTAVRYDIDEQRRDNLKHAIELLGGGRSSFLAGIGMSV